MKSITSYGSSLRAWHLPLANLLIAVCLFSSYTLQAQQNRQKNRTTLNRKALDRNPPTRKNSPASSARLQSATRRIYAQSSSGSHSGTSSRGTTEIMHNNRQRLKRLRQHNMFQQRGMTNFTAHAGRALFKHTLRVSLQKLRYRSKAASPSYNMRIQKSRPIPRERYSSSKWNMGWYVKWNRMRVAKTSRQGERAWKGDIARRRQKVSSEAASRKHENKNMVLAKKGRLNIGGGAPNIGQHAVSPRTLKKRTKKTATFAGNIPQPKLRKNPSSNRYATDTRAPEPETRKTATFAGNIPQPKLRKNPSSNRYAMITRAPNPETRKTATFAGNIPQPKLRKNPSSNRYAMITRAPNPETRKTATFAGNIPQPKLRKNPSSNRYAMITRAPNPETRKTATFAGNIPQPKLRKNPSSNRYAMITRAPNPETRKTATFAGNIPQPKLRKNPSSNRYAMITRAPNPETRKTATFAGNIPQPKLRKNPSSSRYAMITRAPNPETRKMATFAGNIPQPKLRKNPSSSRYAMITRAPNPETRKMATFAGNIHISRSRYSVKGHALNPFGTSPNRAAEQFSGNMKIRKFNSPELHPDAQFAHSFITNTLEKRNLATTLKLFWAKVFRKKELQPPHLRGRSKKLHYDNRERKLWYR